MDLLFCDTPELANSISANNSLEEAISNSIVPVEVKYWRRLEEIRQSKNEDKSRVDRPQDYTSKSMTPNQQIIKYMETVKKRWGILTDGSKWRLFNLEVSRVTSDRFYEFDLEALFLHVKTSNTANRNDRFEFIEAAKYFYYFFGKEMLYGSKQKFKDEKTFVDKIQSYSKTYISHVQESLTEKFVFAMIAACNGYKKSNPEYISEDIRHVSESLLFNTLFIKSCENRNALPLRTDKYKQVSLTLIVDKISTYEPQRSDQLNEEWLKEAFEANFEFTLNGTEIYSQLFELMDVIVTGSDGTGRFGFCIDGFKNSIFTPSEWKFAQSNKLTNLTMVKILYTLFYAKSSDDKKTLLQIPYNYFTARQLGSIYESFLDFEIQLAEDNLIVFQGEWKVARDDRVFSAAIVSNTPHVKKNELYFVPNKKFRKMSGSYYTPDFIVKNISETTLLPFTYGKLSSEILDTKVCDPSMGSGHFLSFALDHLTIEYRRAMRDEFEDFSENYEESGRKILENCIFGVDLNSRAVKLAKLSMWLSTASPNARLGDLSNNFRNGNSLEISTKFRWNVDFSGIFNERGGFDCLLGNPPWEGLKPNDLDFFKRYEIKYGTFSDAKKAQYKRSFVENLKSKKIYDAYVAEQKVIIESLKDRSDFTHQSTSINGRMTAGDSNYYKYFAELFHNLCRKDGRFAIVLPFSVTADNGASGIRKLYTESTKLERVIGLTNRTLEDTAFPGVASNFQIACLVLQKGESTKEYLSKYVSDFREFEKLTLLDIDHLEMKRNFGEYRNLMCVESKRDLDILNKLQKVPRFSDSFDAKVSDGEAHMTSRKEYFSDRKTLYPLITGEQFRSFGTIENVTRYVDPAWAGTVTVAQKPRLILKAIMPNSIKKVQVGWVPARSILSNNVFSVSINSAEKNMVRTVMAILNSDLLEFVVRNSISNFRLVHRNIEELPLSKDIVQKLDTEDFRKLLSKIEKTLSPENLHELNEYIFEAYKIPKLDRARIREYIYGSKNGQLLEAS